MSAIVRKYVLACIAAAGVLAWACPGAQAGTRWEVLEAIHWVENPSNSTRPGRFGELGPYQFRENTWRLHTTKPFRWALERKQADEVAVKHYEWLRRGLEAAGIEASPYNIALAWNSGLDAVITGRAPSAAHHYADRVTNMATQIGRSALANR
ncbi:hypothetical protein K0B96_06715 [Horticoccus luteus]|uniref:Transglycosylase SLT domain-containing protein n=1 Tax=Horticoccus luteus TaxID=2862869 RepID=A0A8F9TYF4_9BACT|nr:hypothetical protein [Horticoccus luteus]QYM80301.1 hypothetical protein K0B96_06715 [Horticoccus luteus]